MGVLLLYELILLSFILYYFIAFVIMPIYNLSIPDTQLFIYNKVGRVPSNLIINMGGVL